MNSFNAMKQTAKEFLIDYLVSEIKKTTPDERKMLLDWADVPTCKQFIEDFRNDDELFNVVLSEVFLDGWVIGRTKPILTDPINTIELNDEGENECIFKIQEIYIKLTKRFNNFGATYAIAFVNPKTIMVPTLIYEEIE